MTIGLKAATTVVLVWALCAVTFADERHAMRGVVLKVDPPTGTLVASIEAVPGYMSAMTMAFAVRQAAALDGLKPGSMIDFTYVVDGSASWAENLRVRAYENFDQEPLESSPLKSHVSLEAIQDLTTTIQPMAAKGR